MTFGQNLQFSSWAKRCTDAVLSDNTRRRGTACIDCTRERAAPAIPIYKWQLPWYNFDWHIIEICITVISKSGNLYETHEGTMLGVIQSMLIKWAPDVHHHIPGGIMCNLFPINQLTTAGRSARVYKYQRYQLQVFLSNWSELYNVAVRTVSVNISVIKM